MSGKTPKKDADDLMKDVSEEPMSIQPRLPSVNILPSSTNLDFLNLVDLGMALDVEESS